MLRDLYRFKPLACLLWLALAQAATAAAAIRQITDESGRVVTLPQTVTRVADAWHANNAMVLLLGGADKLVATSQQAKRQPWLRRLYPRIAQVPAAFNASGDANLETLIGARPDVILMAYGGSMPRWFAAIDSYHIPVVLMPNTSLDGLKKTALLTGEVLGSREFAVAHEYVRYLNANIERVLRVTAKLAPSERPKVLHTSSAGILTADGRASLIDDWINIAGGVNAATLVGLGRPVTMEQVAAWNPDVIIVGSAPNPQNRQAILDDPRWREINAVKNGKVFVNPSGAYLWDRHSAEAALQVLWAAKLLHPAEFADLDVRKETKLFYAKFFHHELSDTEVASILNSTPP
ncbi:MAG TPA: ABC transporter substrate-binding protein [Steroidobacteraceae bacterium]|jgi:iron complex transport system substrate-binding protein|nr:ABC transporter substrate-binding protein [Steroidobacteraceae bacterium]